MVGVGRGVGGREGCRRGRGSMASVKNSQIAN